MLLRLESLELDPGRDARLMAQTDVFWQKYLDHVAAEAEYDEHLDNFRWMIEEFRVSLFAQRLGTVEKVSEKRLKDAWIKVTSGA